MSLVVPAYVPQPAVIWLSHKPKRQRTDDAVFAVSGTNKLELTTFTWITEVETIKWQIRAGHSC